VSPPWRSAKSNAGPTSWPRCWDGESGEVTARTARGQSISVANNALLVLQERNDYMNIAIEVHCVIHG
jgi:hypothetical protein